MELNIALNTIIYLMIFLFPGLIARKFYFSSVHSKQFSQGNLFERFLWTMLTSLLMLGLVSLLFFISNTILDLPLLDSLSYQTIKETFNTLSSNQLPEQGEIEDTYGDFFIFIFALYLFSAIFGGLAYLFNAKAIKLFKYNNYWEKIFNGTYKEKPEENLVFGYAEADVLIDTNEKTKLYSGKVTDYFLSQENNQLETIVLTEVYRYKIINDINGEYIDTLKKEIPGHNFCLNHDKILNINFTYVYQEKSKNRFYKNFGLGINILFYILTIILFLFVFLKEEYLFTSWIKKIIFSLITWILLKLIFQCLKVKINGLLNKNFLKGNMIAGIVFAIPYLWLFKIIDWYWIIPIEIIALIIFGAINKKNKK
ncbi:hypothetical protein [Mesonia sp. K4-1]|uniref:hypothetical protein n=1 Tax=Mesonia sp. K4-1 TaxID=2602760 RepID=UPI0011C9D176|nr:hypothetical protein [Mesonia sp. K4-1]TXK78675.1 hypothetical protein FT986_02460 [Mesonia sp. K4-1]